MRLRKPARYAIVIPWLFIGIPDASGATFTLGEVYDRTLQQNEEIGIAKEQIRQARDEKYRTLSFILPKITLTANYTRYPEKTVDLATSTVFLQPEYSYGMEAKVEQPLYSGGKNWYGLSMAKRGIEVARTNVDLSTEGILLRVARTYYSVLRAQKNLESEQRNVDRLMEHRRVSEVRYRVGEVTESLLLRADAELAKARADLVSFEAELGIRRRELQLMAGFPETFELEEPSLPAIPIGGHSDLVEMAMSERSEVKRSRLNEGISRDRVGYAKANFFPALTFEGSYFNRDQNPRSTFFIDNSWQIGGKVDFPIFEGGLRLAELGQARSMLDAARLERSRVRREIDLEVTGASLNLDATTKTLESREDQLRFATKNYEMVAKQFSVGLASNTDLLDANQTLIEADRDVIAATYARHLAILDLERSIGTFLSSAMEQVRAANQSAGTP